MTENNNNHNTYTDAEDLSSDPTSNININNSQLAESTRKEADHIEQDDGEVGEVKELNSNQNVSLQTGKKAGESEVKPEVDNAGETGRLTNGVENNYADSNRKKILIKVKVLKDGVTTDEQLWFENLEETVRQLRTQLSEKIGVRTNEIRLIYQARTLEDNYSLLFYKLDHESVVHAVCKPNVPSTNVARDESAGSLTSRSQQDSNSTAQATSVNPGVRMPPRGFEFVEVAFNFPSQASSVPCRHVYHERPTQQFDRIRCDGCLHPIAPGEVVHECSPCNKHYCVRCYPRYINIDTAGESREPSANPSVNRQGLQSNFTENNGRQLEEPARVQGMLPGASIQSMNAVQHPNLPQPWRRRRRRGVVGLQELEELEQEIPVGGLGAAPSFLDFFGPSALRDLEAAATGRLNTDGPGRFTGLLSLAQPLKLNGQPLSLPEDMNDVRCKYVIFPGFAQTTHGITTSVQESLCIRVNDLIIHNRRLFLSLESYHFNAGYNLGERPNRNILDISRALSLFIPVIQDLAFLCPENLASFSPGLMQRDIYQEYRVTQLVDLLIAVLTRLSRVLHASPYHRNQD